MSFSSNAKKELCRVPVNRRCCAQAECYGALLYANRFDGGEARVVTESADFAARLPVLFRRAFHLTFDRLPEPGEGGKRVLAVTSREKLAVMADAFGYDPGASVAHHVNFGILEEDHCRLAFFRGAGHLPCLSGSGIGRAAAGERI